MTAEKVITRVEDSYSPWSAWTPCSKSCTQQRFRRCKAEQCAENILTAERTCFRARGRCSARRLPKKQTNTKSIIEDIVYDLIYYDWSEWSACTRTCKKRRYRTCALKRWCKHTVLLEEKECFAPGTDCERRYMFTDRNDHEKYASSEHREEGKGEVPPKERQNISFHGIQHTCRTPKVATGNPESEMSMHCWCSIAMFFKHTTVTQSAFKMKMGSHNTRRAKATRRSRARRSLRGRAQSQSCGTQRRAAAGT